MARPGSPWARRFYRNRPRARRRARVRAYRHDARWNAVRNRLHDLVAGAPDR
ncbi:integral membrane protein [Streptomyces mobaraensis NBRC 13819 = DSM 40847]|uniref:Integral membrane protein n=1 Tax=Streptomyces mobaraensis (strain ATCC 29032 / DSM 40847 / JCM 4168 / NBRC 13819 / NCIMB 11159 / IPCR 16-22) TaxID=1223523 RepID=M3B366_STRM1|nr:integral membrane protein [Streptomyces mobaraensis NBRC 13819 = DSM 40847]